MQCPNCGNECNTNKCPLCGTNLKSDTKTYKKLIAISYYKWINFLFPISAIVLMIMLGLLMKSSTLDGKPINFKEWLILMVLAYIFVVIPFDTIRWNCWGKKKYLKKLSYRIETYKKAELLINMANKLATTINTTTDRTVFETSLTELKDTLQNLIKYEKYGIFNSSSPRHDLQELLNKEDSARKALEDRIINEAFNHSASVQEPTTTATHSRPNYDNMEGHDFEYFCADLLRKNGFINVEVTQGSGDHGIDILAEKDDISYAIQCKCYSSNIGNAAVQQAHTGKSLYKKNVAVVLTNRYFTAQAKEEAQQLGVKLWDRDKLNVLIDKVNINA